MPEHPLNKEDMGPDPMSQFSGWFAEAAALCRQPEAIALATSTTNGAPSVRMVLLKGWDERGFQFFTNYASRKSAELAANPHAALVVYWEPLGRQVRAEGTVVGLGAQDSDRYFAGRPRASQLAAYASRQSTVLASRAELEEAVRAVETRFEGAEVPRPGFWGGFVLEPSVVEFWQHRENRLHDRLAYRRDGEGWILERLAP